jgi:ADP-ribose pyrophosphatase YjhB (NUDIX family)
MPEPATETGVEVYSCTLLDIIFEHEEGSILYGYRTISPYNKVWALVGGRTLFGEGIRDAARRISREYEVVISTAHLIGVFPVAFQGQSDVSLAIASIKLKCEPRPDGLELSRMEWRSHPPRNLGDDYRKMTDKWARLRSALGSLREYEVT